MGKSDPIEEVVEEFPPKKKKKRHTDVNEEINNTGKSVQVEEEVVEKPAPKKKKKRHADVTEDEPEPPEEVVEEPAPKKKDRRHTDFNGAAPSSSKTNGNRHSMDPSTLNKFGYEVESDHVVAIFDHAKLKDGETPRFVEHCFKASKKIFSFKNTASPDVTFVGKESLDKTDDFDYCLAVYNRTTRELEYKPASVLNFKGIAKINPDILSGKDIKPKVNYQADYSMDHKTLAEKRRELTATFGSAKKNKLLEAALRREIDQETLTTLAKSTFQSQNAVVKKEEVDNKEIVTPQSSVMPAANLAAKSPAEIYPRSLFYTEANLQKHGRAAKDFFNTYNDVTKLTNLGLKKYVADVAERIFDSPKTERECYLVLKLLIMSAFVEKVNSNGGKKSKSILYKDISAYKFPGEMISDIQQEFFGEEVNRLGRFGFTYTERDRFIAWFLTLYLIINDFKIFISPLSSQLQFSETVVIKTLTALGCVVSHTTEDEIKKYNTTRIGRLLNPPNDVKKRFKGRRG